MEVNEVENCFWPQEVLLLLAPERAGFLNSVIILHLLFEMVNSGQYLICFVCRRGMLCLASSTQAVTVKIITIRLPNDSFDKDMSCTTLGRNYRHLQVHTV